MVDAINSEFAFEIRAKVSKPLELGAGRNGSRMVFRIIDGSVSGPKFEGRILPGGADYALVRADGVTVIEAHYVIQNVDGTCVYVKNKGIFIANKDAISRMDRGEPVDDHEVYFRAAPVFDAPDGPHCWLSDRLFISTCRFSLDEVTIRVYTVL